ncbi:OsmC family peroxiredoxin [Raineyella fluvialis]|uniref:OsmC family peroxiredoxin n=1 Tax=Raineyella fluvialis TaxID=2662261 RepID=A0A5Q2FE02_9ACTN|nr:OsmC family peroxiredoxin [Raineyella fluvialis]QGF24601.1 OsmC family peroxiredoxin [Raineyella fluvialis]
MAKSTVSTATTHWEGNLFDGKGQTTLATSGVATFDVNWAKRAEAGQGTTNPEELLAAALATCYSMALSNALAQEGHDPSTLDTEAAVTFVPGEGVTGATITVRGDVPGLSAEDFRAKAEWAKDNCPVSQALRAVPKELRVA